MKKIMYVLLGMLFLSCTEPAHESVEDIENEISKNTAMLVQSNPENAINSLKFVILRDNRYYLDEEGAKRNKIEPKIINKLKQDLLDVNKALDEREKFLQQSKGTIREYEIKLMDFQKMDVDSLKKEYKKSSMLRSATVVSGDLSTSSQSERIITVYNPDNTKAIFTAQGRTAIVPFHTFGASSTFGGWQYKDGTGSFSTPITREISLYTNKDNLRLSYRTSDPKGGICGYKLQ